MSIQDNITLDTALEGAGKDSLYGMTSLPMTPKIMARAKHMAKKLKDAQAPVVASLEKQEKAAGHLVGLAGAVGGPLAGLLPDDPAQGLSTAIGAHIGGTASSLTGKGIMRGISGMTGKKYEKLEKAVPLAMRLTGGYTGARLGHGDLRERGKGKEKGRGHEHGHGHEKKSCLLGLDKEAGVIESVMPHLDTIGHYAATYGRHAVDSLAHGAGDVLRGAYDLGMQYPKTTALGLIGGASSAAKKARGAVGDKIKKIQNSWKGRPEKSSMGLKTKLLLGGVGAGGAGYLLANHVRDQQQQQQMQQMQYPPWQMKTSGLRHKAERWIAKQKEPFVDGIGPDKMKLLRNYTVGGGVVGGALGGAMSDEDNRVQGVAHGALAGLGSGLLMSQKHTGIVNRRADEARKKAFKAKLHPSNWNKSSLGITQQKYKDLGSKYNPELTNDLLIAGMSGLALGSATTEIAKRLNKKSNSDGKR